MSQSEMEHTAHENLVCAFAARFRSARTTETAQVLWSRARKDSICAARLARDLSVDVEECCEAQCIAASSAY